MTDARDVITEAIPCNIVYGRPQAADGILRALTTAGFRILGPDEVDPVTVEKCAEVAERMLRFADTTSEADIAISEAIRALGRKA